ncbi:hypothetical protein GCM10029963_79300 [Micromonospora andamanensis]|uniref:hypothetical protein n=1 Tax=Micromonospora andamanensis TaxID=1287068 RepID=UPI00194DC8DD|nr:hypothetical protein [Micromonospora andamanensis]GIJ40512.1 hypothetical protein Vwe01_38370 [Micromonospora andamanensis]
MIRVRIVADDVDQADAVALAIGRMLTVTRESLARPRRSGDGVTVYLDDALPVPSVDDGGVRYARWHPACLRAEQRERRIR